MPEPRLLEISIPGRRRPLRVEHVVFDFNGTLAVNGKLVPGVTPRIRKLSRRVEVVVMTADTYGTARQALAKLPVTLRVVARGREKRRLVESIGADRVAAVGNGANDVLMFRAAALGIAVCGAEGVSAELVRAATLLVREINDAFDLLLHPKRLIATLRR